MDNIYQHLVLCHFPLLGTPYVCGSDALISSHYLTVRISILKSWLTGNVNVTIVIVHLLYISNYNH